MILQYFSASFEVKFDAEIQLCWPVLVQFFDGRIQRRISECICQSPVPDCQPTATELSRSPPLGSGTVFLGTSHLRRHSPPSAFVSRHTVIIFVIHSTFVRACEATLSLWTR